MQRLRRGKQAPAGIALTLAAMAVLGYHPYAEDGGLYLAEIKRVLDPTLYPRSAEFVSGHLGPAIFSTVIALAVRTSGISLAVVLLLLQTLSIGVLLLAVWLLAVRCYPSLQARLGAVGLVAFTMGMPIAGTSLMLMDPYVTARSLVTALILLSLACAIRGQRLLALASVVLALLLHPLMGALGAGAVALLLCSLARESWVRRGGIGAIALLALLTAIALQSTAKPESVQYAKVVASRYYWFLAEWHWYEDLGLAAPMAILGWISLRGKRPERDLARMCVLSGSLAILIAALFAREAASVHAVAHLQPLRSFLVVYVILLAALGARLGDCLLHRSAARWTCAILVLAAGMFAVQRATYPASDHLELPGRQPRNPWEQAFVWVRQQTPKDALFALDADYVHRPGEDAQGFRAIAERSALPDYSKDGGQASIRPDLTRSWSAGQKIQVHLTDETDAQRLAALHQTGVSWVVLGSEANTAFPCPYRNPTVEVCLVPRQPGVSPGTATVQSRQACPLPPSSTLSRQPAPSGRSPHEQQQRTQLPQGHPRLRHQRLLPLVHLLAP